MLDRRVPSEWMDMGRRDGNGMKGWLDTEVIDA